MNPNDPYTVIALVVVALAAGLWLGSWIGRS